MMQRVLILDLNYHLRRSVHVKALAELRDAAGRKTGGVFGLLNTIQLCLTRCGADKVIGVWDGGLSARRLSLYPQDVANKVGYKATRGVLPDMTPEERAEKEETARVLELSRQLATPILMDAGVHVVRWPEREADDVIAVLARRMGGVVTEQVIIASDDWDFAQCCSETTCVFRPMRDEWLSLHNFIDKVGVPIDWATVKKAVEGDTSDNIPGVDGVGPTWIGKAVRAYVKSAQPEFKDDWYDAHQYRNTRPDDLTPFYEFCGGDKRKKLKAIYEQRSVVERNLQLVYFAHEYFPDEHVELLLSQVLTTRQFKEMEIVRQLGELNVQSLLENFAHWSEPFRRIA